MVSRGTDAAELDALVREAESLGAAGDFRTRAETVNRRILELDPNLVVAYTRLAKCLVEKGEPEAAEVLYRRAFELDPTNTIARNRVIDLEVQRRRRGMEGAEQAARQRAAARKTPVQPLTSGELSLLELVMRPWWERRDIAGLVRESMREFGRRIAESAA